MAYRIYPVIETETKCDDYKVKINGKEAELNSARVSAVPFNRRWPGHQRQIDQSETVNFLSLSMDSPIEIEVFPSEPLEDVKIRPRSAGIKYGITERGSIIIELDQPQYFTVEPYGRRRALHIFADPMTEYKTEGGENVICFGCRIVRFTIHKYLINFGVFDGGPRNHIANFFDIWHIKFVKHPDKASATGDRN